MKVPSYQQRLMLLEDILADGIKLFKVLHESEEQLREQLIKGDHRELVEAEQKRTSIREQIASLEDRRKTLVPHGTGLQKYITTTIKKSNQGALLTKLDAVKEQLREIKVVHEVNRNLLAERLRFSKELQEKMLEARLTYNERGQLRKQEEGPSSNLDRSC